MAAGPEASRQSTKRTVFGKSPVSAAMESTGVYWIPIFEILDQQAAIEYLREENRVLKEQLGGKRLRLTDDQRQRLAAKGKALGRKALEATATIVSPDTTYCPLVRPNRF